MSTEEGALTEGKPAPAFTLTGIAPGTDGEELATEKFALKSQRGHKVLIYFYPRDDTPGCTREACGFRDLHKAIIAHNTVIAGISPDTLEKHSAFSKKYTLNFRLLSDPDKRVMERYGAWGEKMMYGKKTTGVIRSTVLIDERGKVLKHWRRVARAADHPAKVLEFLDSLEV